MPAKRGRHRKSYLLDAVLAIIAALGVVSVVWGYALAYQIGFGMAMGGA